MNKIIAIAYLGMLFISPLAGQTATFNSRALEYGIGGAASAPAPKKPKFDPMNANTWHDENGKKLLVTLCGLMFGNQYPDAKNLKKGADGSLECLFTPAKKFMCFNSYKSFLTHIPKLCTAL